MFKVHEKLYSRDGVNSKNKYVPLLLRSAYEQAHTFNSFSDNRHPLKQQGRKDTKTKQANLY